METCKELEERKKELLAELAEIDRKLLAKADEIDEVNIAKAIAECLDLDIEELKGPGGAWYRQHRLYTLHSRKAFDKLVENLPEKSYLCGYDELNWYGDYVEGTTGRLRNTDCLVMLDETNAIVFRLKEYYDEEFIKLKKTDFYIVGYLGSGKLKIKAEAEDFDGETQVIRIVDSNNNYEAFSYIVDGDYTLFDGQDVVDVIKTVDLTSFVIKDGEDYHIQKVKTRKEEKQN